MKISTAIKTCRLRAGMSQEELAKKSGIQQSYISNVERGIITPRNATIKKICSGLGLPMPLLIMMAIENSDVKANKKRIYSELKKPINDLIELALQKIYG